MRHGVSAACCVRHGVFPFARDRQKRGKPAVGERTVSRTCMWMWPPAVEMTTANSGTTPLSRLGREKTVPVCITGVFNLFEIYTLFDPSKPLQ
jgi:hypothetical protein